MHPPAPFVDVHCHLLPGVDDGAKSWTESLAMARIARDDGIDTIVATPHQLGAFRHNRGERIRDAAHQVQQYLLEEGVDLTVRPGASVCVDGDIFSQIEHDNVVTLGDHFRHILLEAPHRSVPFLRACLDGLSAIGLVAILAHPERNFTLLREPSMIRALVEQGCLMQIDAGSLTGAFSAASQALADRMIREGWAHFVGTDAHGCRARRPMMMRAYLRVAMTAGEQTAYELFCRNPSQVAQGEAVDPEITKPKKKFSGWLHLRRAA